MRVLDATATLATVLGDEGLYNGMLPSLLAFGIVKRRVTKVVRGVDLHALPPEQKMACRNLHIGGRHMQRRPAEAVADIEVAAEFQQALQLLDVVLRRRLAHLMAFVEHAQESSARHEELAACVALRAECVLQRRGPPPILAVDMRAILNEQLAVVNVALGGSDVQCSPLVKVDDVHFHAVAADGRQPGCAIASCCLAEILDVDVRPSHGALVVEPLGSRVVVVTQGVA
mmetsp:Transcript_12949/g.38056  ORF Transcript_12949/g.38056 Transcript_12949/m.38056 type:complete len:229 (-) Transcript_12949:2397-3083(-)